MWVFIILCFIFGIIYDRLYISINSVKGHIGVDHKTLLSKILFPYNEYNDRIINKKCKYIFIKINHNADIPRDKHII